MKILSFTFLIYIFLATHTVILKAETLPIQKNPGATLLERVPAETDILIGMVNNYCSGVIVDLGRDPSRNAVFLTNGHCATDRFIPPGKFVMNVPYTRSTVQIGIATGVKEISKNNKILYGVFTGTDIALIEVGITYHELSLLGVIPYKISKNEPKVGDRLLLVSGYWQEKEFCTIKQKAFKVIEGAYTFFGSYVFEPDCEMVGGFSGSPLIDLSTKEVVAIANSGGGNLENCTDMNPCIVDENGLKTPLKLGENIAQRTDGIMDCVNQNGDVQLDLQDCKLLK